MARTSYHHGDLRAALIEAGLEITREGGPSALGIRDVTRRVGVSPNAAYRHFADRQALLAAVSMAIQERMAAEMQVRPRRGGTAQSRAVARLQAVGEGYIGFALTEPGWFQVVFFGAGPPPRLVDEVEFAPPFAALQGALDALLEAEVITPAQREGAEWPCWSTVHGFAEIALRGPLVERPVAEQRALARRAVATIIAGLRADGP